MKRRRERRHAQAPRLILDSHSPLWTPSGSRARLPGREGRHLYRAQGRGNINNYSRDQSTKVYTLHRGATALRSRLATGCHSLVVQARRCSSFQLTHMSCEDHAQSIKSAMASKGKTRTATALTTLPAR